MTNKYGDMYAWISNRAFNLHMKDLDTLKSKYQRRAYDIPRHMVKAMKREHLVDALLVEEFGSDVIVEYKTQCAEWDKCKHFVEN